MSKPTIFAFGLSAAMCLALNVYAADLPNPTLTPGDTSDVGLSILCTPGYTKGVRDVTTNEKKRVFSEYGITSHKPKEYEVDHLISLELGGSNSIKNLWPQSYLTCPWNAHVKDQFENYLHAEICAGRMSLGDAQRIISTDWIAGYRKYLGEPKEICSGDNTTTP